MGRSDLKYGDSVAFIQHCATGLWLSYQTFETKKRGVGRVEEKKVTELIFFNCLAVQDFTKTFVNLNMSAVCIIADQIC